MSRIKNVLTVFTGLSLIVVLVALITPTKTPIVTFSGQLVDLR